MTSGTAPNTSIILSQDEISYINLYFNGGKSAAIHDAMDRLMNTNPAPLTVTIDDLTPGVSAYSQGKYILPALEIDGEARKLIVDLNDDGQNAQSMRSYHGFWRTIPICWDAYEGIEIVSPSALTEWISRDYVQEAIGTYFAESDEDWDGNNLKATYTDDATDILENLIAEVEGLPRESWQIWTADEWYGQVTTDDIGISAETTDEEIERIADEETANLLAGKDVDPDHIVLENAVEYLAEVRNELREDDE